MNRILALLLFVSMLGNFVGLFVLYKFIGAKKAIEYVKDDLEKSNQTIEDLTGVLDRLYLHKMVFMHHSVGYGILHEGGLRDSLLALGVLVKGATYGDSLGETTDISDWVPKFQKEMDKILTFKAHPDKYYSDRSSNEIVTFKSCFPNSDITADGSGLGDPLSKERTLANYKAAFSQLKNEISKHKDKLFIYVTAPPLVPEETSAQNARRAREFNNWLMNEYLPECRESSGLQNFWIFNLFDVLADKDNFLKAEYRRNKPHNSHPNSEANRLAALKYLEFFRPIWREWLSKHNGQVASFEEAR
jgi:hypothetical protein